MKDFRDHPAQPSVAALAATLVRLVTEAKTLEPDRYAGACSWQDLNDVCDANEFLLEAEQILGVPDDPAWEVGRWHNAAIEAAEIALFPKPTGPSVVGVDVGRVWVEYRNGVVLRMYVEDPIDIDCIVYDGNPGCDVNDDDSAFWNAVRDYLGPLDGKPAISWLPG